MTTTTASQRESVIRSAKFPRKPAVIPYSQSKRIIGNFLTGNTGKLSHIDDDIGRIETRLRREPDGWMQDELKRNLDALKAFKAAFTKNRLKRLSFLPGPVDLAMKLGGVRINCRLDVSVSETGGDDVTYSGGCVLFVANTDSSRKNLEDRSKSVATMIQWELESSNPNIEPLPRLCISFDIFGQKITKAPNTSTRLRSQMRSSCEEAAGRWNTVEPPGGYDGPPWR